MSKLQKFPTQIASLRFAKAEIREKERSEEKPATVADSGLTTWDRTAPPGEVRLRIVLVSMAGPRSQDEVE